PAKGRMKTRRSFSPFIYSSCLITILTSCHEAPPPSTVVTTASAQTIPSGSTDGMERAAVASRRALTLLGARAAVAGALEEAKRLGSPGAAVAVVDEGGNPIASERLDGTFAAGARVSLGKAQTAVSFKKPTRFFEEVIRNGRTPMIALEGFTPLQGGI